MFDSVGVNYSVARFLMQKPKLKVNAKKSGVARPWKRKLLGFSVTANKAPKRRISPEAVKRLKSRVRTLTRRTRGVSIENVVEELSRYLPEWLGYSGFCKTPSVLRNLESRCEDVYAAVCGGSGREDAAAMQRYVRGASDVTWLHTQQEDHTARGESAAVQSSVVPCPVPTLPHWDYQNSLIAATLSQPNRRLRTRTRCDVGGGEPQGSPPIAIVCCL